MSSNVIKHQKQHKILTKGGEEHYFPSNMKQQLYDSLSSGARFVEIGDCLIPFTEIKIIKPALSGESRLKDFPVEARQYAEEKAKNREVALNLKSSTDDKIQYAQKFMKENQNIK